MRFTDENSYLFATGNKNGLITNETYDIFLRDCTIFIRFTPDLEAYQEKMGAGDRYHGCVVGKNGMHIGLFFTSFRGGDDKISYLIGFEYWVVEEDGTKGLRYMNFPVPEGKYGKSFDVAIRRTEGQFLFSVDGQWKRLPAENLIEDYAYNFLWLGAATRISESHNNIFYGDIDRVHIQYGVADDKQERYFFRRYDKFLDDIKENPEREYIFTSDFKQVTEYKILDQSPNGNHPIRYSKQWLD